jgi:hypothetical protein
MQHVYLENEKAPASAGAFSFVSHRPYAGFLSGEFKQPS